MQFTNIFEILIDQHRPSCKGKCIPLISEMLSTCPQSSSQWSSTSALKVERLTKVFGAQQKVMGVKLSLQTIHGCQVKGEFWDSKINSSLLISEAVYQTYGTCLEADMLILGAQKNDLDATTASFHIVSANTQTTYVDRHSPLWDKHWLSTHLCLIPPIYAMSCKCWLAPRGPWATGVPMLLHAEMKAWLQSCALWPKLLNCPHHQRKSWPAVSMVITRPEVAVVSPSGQWDQADASCRSKSCSDSGDSGLCPSGVGLYHVCL